MPIIHFLKNRPPMTVDSDANLMSSLLEKGVPVASSCRGDGVCCKCLIEVVAGNQNLSPETERELFLREKYAFGKSARVSCQVKVLNDITIDASYW
jgi:2Fe-2S ferredoxin